ncbi:flagellar basal-body MS-ring/collar protein FliF [Scopulibacillus cellulosilyticus]|uniref:Flagellar M-ring protein n=1 Tax=Scopulibacillus cellulosilyticus TaxID=2665665 RepID=A0ABW2PT58_9BACL
MKDKLKNILEKIKGVWNRFSRKQKRWLIFLSSAAVIIIIAVSVLTSIPHYAPLYSHLSASETGQIKETLDSKGIKYKLSDNGTTISVPKDQVDNLKVELAADGIPKTGDIDYSVFSNNTSFGMTDKQFDVMEREAMETELSNLISQIKGVNSAKVMINMPKSSEWVSDKPQKASASVVLHLEPGYQLNDEQVQGLYHLVSKSVPNLPEDNIVIMDQFFNYYDKKSSDSSSALSAYQQQREIKNDIEKDIREQVQQMLGMMMGSEKVMVNVTADVDFTKERTKEDLIKPVDPNSLDGVQVSAEHITETYSGKGAVGKAGTGSNDVPTYQASSDGNGNYKLEEERINNEFNRIHNTIVKAPYTIKDMGIQVMVEPPDPNNPASLPGQRIDDIKQILNTVVRTTLADQGGQELNPSDIDQKTMVAVEKFNGKIPDQKQKSNGFPWWLYMIIGIITTVMIILLIWLFRRRRNDKDEDVIDLEEYTIPAENLESNQTRDKPEVQKYKQLQVMAKEKPDEFVKLLRTWLSED